MSVLCGEWRMGSSPPTRQRPLARSGPRRSLTATECRPAQHETGQTRSSQSSVSLILSYPSDRIIALTIFVDVWFPSDDRGRGHSQAEHDLLAILALEPLYGGERCCGCTRSRCIARGGVSHGLERRRRGGDGVSGGRIMLRIERPIEARSMRTSWAGLSLRERPCRATDGGSGSSGGCRLICDGVIPRIRHLREVDLILAIGHGEVVLALLGDEADRRWRGADAQTREKRSSRGARRENMADPYAARCLKAYSQQRVSTDVFLVRALRTLGFAFLARGGEAG